MNPQENTKPFAIRRLEANQIGPFDRLEIDFPEKQIEGKAEIHILTGDNGTGKSTVLQMLANCLATGSKTLEKKLWSKENSHYSLNFTEEETMSYDSQLVKPEDNIYTAAYYKGLGSNFNSILPSRLQKYAETSIHDPLDIAFFAYSGYRKLPDSAIESITDISANSLENTLDFENSTNAKQFVNWLSTALINVALGKLNGVENVKEPTEYYSYKVSIEEIEKAISSVTEQKIKFEIRGGTPLMILIHVDNQPLEFDQLPDGLKSIISWLGDLIMHLFLLRWSKVIYPMERNFVLFLDEIEIHLHPSWQRKILPVVQRLFPNAQIFISTHSPFVVGSVDGAWVHRFVKNKDGYSQAQGEPILSEDSNSYDYILAEIFGVTERFGIEVERDLRRFKQFKNQIVHGQAYDQAEFDQLVQELLSQSSEIQTIIGMELRQLSRLTNRSFA